MQFPVRPPGATSRRPERRVSDRRRTVITGAGGCATGGPGGVRPARSPLGDRGFIGHNMCGYRCLCQSIGCVATRAGRPVQGAGSTVAVQRDDDLNPGASGSTSCAETSRPATSLTQRVIPSLRGWAYGDAGTATSSDDATSRMRATDAASPESTRALVRTSTTTSVSCPATGRTTRNTSGAFA